MHEALECVEGDRIQFFRKFRRVVVWGYGRSLRSHVIFQFRVVFDRSVDHFKQGLTEHDPAQNDGLNVITFANIFDLIISCGGNCGCRVHCLLDCL